MASQLQEGVIEVYSNDSAFAALRSDSSLVTWGAAAAGGQETLQGVLKVYATESAFAVLRHQGDVVCWGDPLSGGHCEAHTYIYIIDVRGLLKQKQ